MLEVYGPELTAFFKVIFINVVLSGDNAVVVGMAAAGVPAAIRSKVIFGGIAAAVVLRIIFAFAAAQLLHLPGLQLAGGLLLLWVCWGMFNEIRQQHKDEALTAAIESDPDAALVPVPEKQKTFMQAMMQILVADVSMSLDNVLAVAGAAMEHPMVMLFGLVLSVALMGAAASLIANLLARYRWIAWVGLVIIFYVALEMLYEGTEKVLPLLGLH
jgi:YjbE family integral membrane protein